MKFLTARSNQDYYTKLKPTVSIKIIIKFDMAVLCKA